MCWGGGCGGAQFRASRSAASLGFWKMILTAACRCRDAGRMLACKYHLGICERGRFPREARPAGRHACEIHVRIHITNHCKQASPPPLSPFHKILGVRLWFFLISQLYLVDVKKYREVGAPCRARQCHGGAWLCR